MVTSVRQHKQAEWSLVKKKKVGYDPTHEDPTMMSELTAKSRKKLATSQFAVPGKRKYPIHDRAHAQNALARVAQHGTPEEKRRVRAAVARKYPGMMKKKEGGK